MLSTEKIQEKSAKAKYYTFGHDPSCKEKLGKLSAYRLQQNTIIL